MQFAWQNQRFLIANRAIKRLAQHDQFTYRGRYETLEYNNLLHLSIPASHPP